MSDSNTSHEKLSEEQLEVFRVLYPLYKEEVFQRREHMMRLSAFASAFLVLLLVTVMAVSPGHSPGSTTRWFAISGVALFSGLFAFLIVQQFDRHQMAKQQLIQLEQIFELYKEDWYLPGKTVYPKNWQTDWLHDRSLTVYLTVLAALTALVICAMMVRP